MKKRSKVLRSSQQLLDQMRMKWWTCLAPRTITTPPWWWFCLSRWCGMSTRWSSSAASSIMAKIMVPCSTSSVDWVIIGHTICRPSCQQNAGQLWPSSSHLLVLFCGQPHYVFLHVEEIFLLVKELLEFSVFDPDNLFLMKSYSLWGLSCACCCYIRWISTAHSAL